MPLSDGSAGIGLNLYQDKIGFETHSDLYVNYAYRLQLQKGITFSLGIKGGMSFYQANLTNAVTPEPQNFDPIFASNTKAAVPKTGAGIFLTSSRTYFGFSVPVLTALIPNSNFVFADDNVYLRHHFYATGGHIFDIPGTDLQLKPSIFLKYHKAAPLQLDLCAQLWYKDLFSFGLSYRTGDAIAAITDIAISIQFVLSYAYDYTNSEFRNIGQGAHEFKTDLRILGELGGLGIPPHLSRNQFTYHDD